MTYRKIWPRTANAALSIGALGILACSEESPGIPPGGMTGTDAAVTSNAAASTTGSAVTITSAASTIGSVTSTTAGSTGAGMNTVTTGSSASTGGPVTSTTGGAPTTTGGFGGMTSGGDTTEGTTTGGMTGAGGMGGNGDATVSDTTSTTGGTTSGDDPNSGPNTMGWIGCSMAENVASGYRRIGGTRMWGPYGNGGAVVQSWTDTNGAAWNRFDNQVSQNGTPAAVWIQICIFQTGATIQEIRQLVANTREHAPGAYIYITGQPLYVEGQTCLLAGGEGGPESTDALAQQMAAEDPDVHYAGTFGPLGPGTVQASDTTGCHASTEGENLLGEQAKEKFGQP